MSDPTRLKRWRMILGGGPSEGTGVALEGLDARLDGAMAALYDQGMSQQMSPEDKMKNRMNVGKGASKPTVARWLGDIRELFPSSVVQVMQKDALERYNLKQMLLEPELLSQLEPDIHLTATLLSLKDVLPAKARETARMVVRKVVDDLLKRLEQPTRQAVQGALNRAVRNRRPRHREIDWNRTIRANLRHYQREQRTLIPETRIGYGRKRSSLRDVFLCVDQSGSMASSVVYAGLFGAVLASLPALTTRVVVYDTEVVDLTDHLSDPVDVMFGTQLGGGNDTPRALAYCAPLISRPQDSIFVLISDLYEGHGSAEMIRRLREFSSAGVQVIVLLALADDGRPSFDEQNASSLAGLGIPVFACTPDLFPELMAAAIQKGDIAAWAASRDIVTARGNA